MTTWRPSSTIRVLALGLHWRHGRLLACEIRDDDGRITGVRPLGGSVEFGETANVAVLREFKEELGIEVVVLGEPIVMENLYVHEGVAGHEVVFLFEVALPAGAFENQESILFHDDNGASCVACWYALSELDFDGAPDLYPKGLKARLSAGPRS